MNARTILNGTLSTVLFAWFLAATLPALNSTALSPFQAYISTPLLLMAAGLGGLGLYHALGIMQQHLMVACRSASGRLGAPRATDHQSLLYRWLHPGHR
jgi:hypothetical protein